MAFLQGNLSLMVGAVLLFLLLGMRAASRERAFRNDVSGAIVLLVCFLTLRSGAWALKPFLSQPFEKTLTVGWKLAFSFALIRSVVSCALWVLRLRARHTPRIVRDVIDFGLYVLSAVPILKTELDIDITSVVATSAVVSLVIGLALQDTLGNLFAGLSLQVERPFQVGDFVTIGAHTGKVTQVAWRATRIETTRGVSITLPNSHLAKEPVQNYSRGYDPVGIDLHLSVAFDTPPNRVKSVVLKTLAEIPEVVAQPPPQCRFFRYVESAIDYRIRFFIVDFNDAERLNDEIYSRLWYRLRREGIEVPYPHRTYTPRRREPAHDVAQRRLEELLASVDLFALLSRTEGAALAAQVKQRSFGTGERVIEAGQPGTAFYVVASGEVLMHAGGADPSADPELKRLGPGEYFGEMALLTGEPRTVTVTAAEDATLLELDRDMMSQLFHRHPRLARQVSAILAKRRAESIRASSAREGVRDEELSDPGRILGRLRKVFRIGD